MKRLRVWFLVWWRYHRRGNAPTVEQLVDVLVEVGEVKQAEREEAEQFFYLQRISEAARSIADHLGGKP
jgi:hypothetical protein